jgi:glycosyltransferase involved in cell wall biosynthesis
LITIDENLPGAEDYLQKIEIQKAAIFNLGEISQQELQHYYLNSHLFIYPSESETFGNPLVEAMSFGLPVIVPSLGYSRSVLGASGIYYDVNDVTDCVEKIESVVHDTLHYRKKSCESYSQLDLYLVSKIWAENYIKLISHL